MLKQSDPEIFKLLGEEIQRQSQKLQLIPSENFTSKAVREAVGSVFMHKYSEGQIAKRYYEGNDVIDKLETICKKRALMAFHLNPTDWHVNVQALSGSIANLAVYNALLEPGEKIMGMYLFDGGHLSHGWQYKNKKISLSSKIYQANYYYVNKKTNLFDYDEVRKEVLKVKPKILISGGTAYPREINYQKLSQCAKEVKAYYMADIAHEAGLVAAGVNESPFKYADVVTMTTQKTLRGPRGALIFCKKNLADLIDRSVFPGLQGGPFNHSIAGIAVALKEASTKEFKTYAKQVFKNAQVLAEELMKLDYNIITGGTDKHLLLIDLRNKDIPAKLAAKALDIAGITLNCNTIPNEPNSPFNPSGLRLGTPTVTTRGMKENEMKLIAKLLNDTIELIRPFGSFERTDFIKAVSKDKGLREIYHKVNKLCKKFPLAE